MLTKQVIIAIAYLAAAKSSHLLAFEGSNAAPIWPATGIGLAAVLLLGYRIWPAIFIGGFLATASAFPTLGLSLTLSCAGAFFTAVGNTLESLLGAFLILRFTAWPNQFERHSDTFRFILGGAIVPAVVSATIGTTAQAVVIGNWKSYGAIWLTWWLGDAAGTLVVAPLILTCKQRMREWQWKKAVEGAVLLALLLALGWLVFQRDYHVQYTLLFLLSWVVFRFSHFEASVMIVLLSILAIMGTMQGIGPFVTPSLNESLLLLQGYVATSAVMAMILCSLIAERERSEEETQQEKALLRCIIDSASDLIFIKDRSSVYLGCNKASEKLIGLPESEQIGKSDYDFFNLEIAQLIQERDRKVIETGASLQTEEWMTYPDGSKVLLDTLKVPYYGVDGEIHGLVGISRDITARKRGEESVRKTGAYNRSLVEASLDPLVTIGQDGRITDVNAATEDVTGYPREALIGTDFSDYFTDPEKARTGYRQVFQEGVVRDYPLEIRRRDGKVTSVLYNASVYRDEGGQVLGVFAAARDITERKGMEEKISKLNKELEQRVQERTSELEGMNSELARMNRIFVGREIRMVELKKRITELEKTISG
jgi:PAS domain S-box-containing protein